MVIPTWAGVPVGVELSGITTDEIRTPYQNRLSRLQEVG